MEAVSQGAEVFYPSRLSYRKKYLEQEVINMSSCHLSGVFRIHPFIGRCQI